MTLDEAQAKVEEWLIKTSLYEALTDDSDDSRANAISAFCTRERPFDMYCVHCKRISTFAPRVDGYVPDPYKVAAQLRDGVPNPYLRMTQFQIDATCARDNQHVVRFVLLHDGQKLQKIGQYPSLADLSIPETAQFFKVLGQERLGELNRAIGLAAHGIGVGSYIYLRRVFESLVEEAHREAAREEEGDDEFNDWDEDAYKGARMGERIEMLADYLPKFLVENPLLYGILSKHIHELSEDECKQNFDLMKEAILIIARDKLKAREDQEHRQRTANLLQQIGSTMKGSGA